MISGTAIKRLREAFADGLSSRAAAQLAGCCFDTARFYRRAMEHAGLVEPRSFRRTSAGRIQDTANMGAYARGLWGPAESRRSGTKRLCATVGLLATVE